MDVINFTEFIVKKIVKNPDMVKVQLFENEGEGPIVEIIVHHDDMGTVIGRSGKVASSLRTLIQSYALVNNMPKLKINIDSF